MGHSYCSGPMVFSEDLKSYCSAASAKKNLQLRSPGCSHNANRVELREYYGNGFEKDIQEFLQQEQPPPQPMPPLSRSHSKRRKQIVDVLFRSRYRSSRPMIRHSSPPPSVAKDQMTIEGRKYAQIGLDDKQMYEVGNSSTYQINHRKQPVTLATAGSLNCKMKGKPTVSIEKLVDPAPQLEIVNDYGLGISKEWPPELLESGETKLQQEAVTETRNRFPSPPISTPKHGTGPRVRDFASSRLNEPPGMQAPSFIRQPSPILKVPHDASSWTHSHVSAVYKSTLNINGTRAHTSQNLDPVPIRTQVRLQASPTKTPRRSRQKSSLDMVASPILRGHSKTASMLSTNDSTVDDVQSDAESAVVLEAQSAEFVRAQGAAGYYNGSVKPPKPGPAPTRALPSLPEGYDGSTMVQRGSIDSGQGRMSLESGPGGSPKKIPPKSPARRYGYLPPSTVASRGASSSPWKSMDSETKQEPSQIPIMEQPMSSSPLLPPNDLLPKPPSPAALEQRQNHRTRSTKALKMRDLERLKACRSATSPAVLPDAKPMDQQDDRKEIVFLPSTRYNAKPSSAGQRPQASHFSDLSAETSQQDGKHKPAYDFSPVVVIAEQEPIVNREPSLCDSKQAASGSNLPLPSQPPNSPASLPTTLPLQFPIPPLPSLESHTAPPRGITTDPLLELAFDPLTHRISMSHADLEARLESRISALEKKNVLLEKAILAVLNMSDTFNIQPPVPSGGDRSSGLSGASSLPGWDSRVESMIRGLQGGARMSTASGP